MIKRMLAAVVLLALAGASHAEDQVMRIVRGQTHVEPVPGVRQVAIGDPGIADVRIVSGGRDILLVGLAEGMTTLELWRGNQKERRLVRVLARDPRLIADDLSAMLEDLPGVEVRIAGERVVLSGRTTRPADSQRIDALLRLHPDVLDFVERHRVDLDVMVRIDVQLVEIRRGRDRDLGITWPGAVAAAGQIELRGGLVPGLGPFDGSIVLTEDLRAGLHALESSGHARSLARPALVSRSGKPASFRAGGMLPVPVASGPGQVSIDWKPYGIGLEILPRVDESGNFDLEISVESSDLDPANAVAAAQGSVPALRARTMRTTVNLRAGQSLVIAELQDRRESKSVDGVAGLSRLPILGELFRRRRWGANEAETYLIVTPMVVRENPEAAAAAQRRYDEAGDAVVPKVLE